MSGSLSLPNSLSEAEQLRNEHAHFQVAIERTHSAANQCLRKAEAILLSSSALSDAQRQTSSDIIECVTRKWQNLVQCAEERHKLVTASLNFYKTAEQVGGFFCESLFSFLLALDSSIGGFFWQVCSVLDSLEREYRREEDFCGFANSSVNSVLGN